MAKCKLCHQEKTLLKSHIFPEFLYKPMYDKNHQYLVISSDDTKKIKKVRKGIYELLFCENCEKKIEEYEDYSAKVFFAESGLNIGINKDEKGFIFSGLDYRKFKLFQVSLLWRSSISTRPEMHHTDLGPHAEKMRLMILNDDPGEPYEYGAGIFFVPVYSTELEAFIYPPEEIPRKIEGHRWYRAIFNGLLWLFIVSNHSNRFTKKGTFISKEGILKIANSGIKGQKFLENLTMNLVKDRKIE